MLYAGVCSTLGGQKYSWVSWSGIYGGYEMPDAGARNPPSVLCKNGTLLTAVHLSSPEIILLKLCAYVYTATKGEQILLWYGHCLCYVSKNYIGRREEFSLKTSLTAVYLLEYEAQNWAEDIALWIKCLRHKHKDPCLDPQPMKKLSLSAKSVTIKYSASGQSQTDPRCLLANQSSQVIYSRSSERSCHTQDKVYNNKDAWHDLWHLYMSYTHLHTHMHALCKYTYINP